METEKFLAHHEKSEELLSAIQYFEGMSKRRKSDAIIFEKTGMVGVSKIMAHRHDIAERAKKRMEQLYLKHLQTLNP